MESFLTDLAKPYVEKLINGVIAESSYICCFTCITKDFEEEKAKLEIERTNFKQRIEVATRRGEDVQGNALCWEEEVDKIIQEDTKTKQKCCFELFPHCIWRYRRGKELANKKNHIKELMKTGKELTVGLPARLPDVERYSSQHYMHFKSRETKYIELLDELKDDNNYIIGLQGMGGTGKTTLIKEVGKKLKQSKQFTHIIDTAVSFSPNIKKIQDDIAGPLGLKFDDCNESDRPKKLWSRLTNGEKILLILDDVWGEIDFNEIGIPYSDNHKGCRIIVTTRSLLVCKKLGCNKTIQLDLLSEEDSWIMFKRHAGLNETSPKFFLDKGLKIANECKRLPIAIAVIASNLKGEQRRDEWDVALKSLQKHITMHGVDDELVKIYKCLKFSYDNMKNEKAKSLFLLCSVFREDEDILIERLVRLAIGGGLFGEDYGSYGDARSQVVISKNKLLDSCLLLESDQRTVKMHDLVRDAAQWIANKEIQTVRVYGKNQKAMVEMEKNIKYLSCEGKPEDVFSCKLDGAKLEILIIIMYTDEYDWDKKIEVPDSFFENNTGLRVFYLLGGSSWRVLSLPQSIQSLKIIRSLIFTSSDLGDISILGDLQSLETLDLKECSIKELPSGITKLERFRLLKLEQCIIWRNNPFEVIERCSSLQELYFFTSFNQFCQEITFPKLQRFSVDTSYQNDYPSSKYVCFRGFDDLFLSESTLKYCMQEAEVLRLGRIEGGWRNIIPEIIPLDHGMNDLAVLDLSCISQLKCLIDTKHTYSVSHVFSKLVELHLENMENLEELCNGPLSFDSFKSLENLSIKDCKHLRSLFKCNLNLGNLKTMSLEGCPMLISLFELSTARSLVLLEILEIIDCAHLEYILTDERKWEGTRGEIIDCEPVFLKLKVLEIVRCPKFETILPFVSACDLSALESITMRSCDKLKYIFGQDVKIGSLKNIKLHDVPNLIDIFPECNHTMSLSIKRSSSISGSSSKPPTQSEPIKCNSFSWTYMYCCGKKYEKKLKSTTSTKIPLVHENQPQSNLKESNSYCLNINIWERAQCLSRQSMILCNIKEIELFQLKKIKSVCILSIAPRMLLETLIIEDCDDLKHIIIDTRDHDSTIHGNNLRNVFPKLKELYIDNCIQLEYIFGHYTDDHQNHPEIHLHLLALEYLHLFNLSSLVAISSKQYHTTFQKLKDFELSNCPQVTNVKSISDFISHPSGTRSTDYTIIQELRGNMESLESLVLNKSKVESIFCVNEVNEQQINSVLQKIRLEDLYVTTCLFVGPKNSFSLLNLTTIKIVRCEKLQVIFSDSILRCLPQLLDIMIIECNELKHIVEDDLENKKMSNSSSSRPCFPKLRLLVVKKCNKLKCVFPISICNELPELKFLIIREADELEEIFKSEGEEIQEVKIPNLNFVAFVNLPSLFQTQGIHFQTIEYHFVMACQKLSLTSTSIPEYFGEILDYSAYRMIDNQTTSSLIDLYYELSRDSIAHDTGTKIYAAENEVETTSEHELTSSQIKMKQSPEAEFEFVENVPNLEIPTELMNEQSTSQNCTMNQQYPLGESDATVIPSQENNGIEIRVKEGTTSTNAKTKSSSTQLELEDGDNQIAFNSISIAMTETNDQDSLNDDVAVKVSSIVEQRFPKEDDIIASKARPSSSASGFPLVPSKGDTSQKVEELSSSLLVTRELEQLVSKKHLNSEHLSLLTDFLVKHPSVLLRDTSLSNRYKGYAYNCLAELLKLLQTHSVLDVLGSSHSEFIELLHDVRKFGFAKEWLDLVEKRVLYRGLQVSQDALQKLWDSNHILTQQAEDLKQQLATTKAILESIIQLDPQILETATALSDPIGY